jgi:hypothetical protein
LEFLEESKGIFSVLGKDWDLSVFKELGVSCISIYILISGGIFYFYNLLFGINFMMDVV